MRRPAKYDRLCSYVSTQACKYIIWDWHDDVVNMMLTMVTMTFEPSLESSQDYMSEEMLAFRFGGGAAPSPSSPLPLLYI